MCDNKVQTTIADYFQNKSRVDLKRAFGPVLWNEVKRHTRSTSDGADDIASASADKRSLSAASSSAPTTPPVSKRSRSTSLTADDWGP